MIKRLLALFLFIGISAMAFAADSPDLVTAKVSVPDQSSASLQKALPQAFAQVLVNVSGNPNISSVPAVANNKRDLSTFLQNYSFIRENGPQGEAELSVQITFDKAAIDDFLREAGQSHAQAHYAPVRLEVLGINSLQDYLDVVHAIKNIPEIKQVSVSDSNGSSLIVSVLSDGGAQNLTQALSKNPNFVSNSQTGQADLSYRWVRTS